MILISILINLINFFNMKFALATSLIAAAAASQVTFGVFSDLHLQLEYTPDSSVDDCGRLDPDTRSIPLGGGWLSLQELRLKATGNQRALLGRLGCDAPVSLVRYMLTLFNRINSGEKVDYITLDGDLVAHGIASNTPVDPLNPTMKETASIAQHYSYLKLTHQKAQSLFSEAFPNTPVFITFGNNDANFHDNPAWASNANDFYGFMYDLWFVRHSPNQKF